MIEKGGWIMIETKKRMKDDWKKKKKLEHD